MPNPTQYTDINIVTSVAGYFANQLVASGWAIYAQATGIMSGVATQGTVTLVPEFPNEPGFLVLPGGPRTPNEVQIPAFSIHITRAPIDERRAGLGQDLFVQRLQITIDGFVVSQAQHLAFGTMFRNWFREDTYISIYDWESNPTTPPLVDDHNTYIQNRQVEQMEMTALPNPVRYYINMTADLVFYD